MKLYDISKQAEISLKLSKDGKTATVPVKANRIVNNMLVIKPIIIKGKVVTFKEQEGLTIDLIYEGKNKKPLIWKNVTYGAVKYKGQSCVVLTDDRDGLPFNRRGEYRLPMDITGMLNLNEYVVIHDISGSGISFYSPLDKKREIGEDIKLRFTGGYEEISVAGKIVREVPVENKYLYGCTINRSLQVEGFVATEQRRRMTLSRKVI